MQKQQGAGTGSFLNFCPWEVLLRFFCCNLFLAFLLSADVVSIFSEILLLRLSVTCRFTKQHSQTHHAHPCLHPYLFHFSVLSHVFLLWFSFKTYFSLPSLCFYCLCPYLFHVDLDLFSLLYSFSLRSLRKLHCPGAMMLSCPFALPVIVSLSSGLSFLLYLGALPSGLLPLAVLLLLVFAVADPNPVYCSCLVFQGLPKYPSHSLVSMFVFASFLVELWRCACSFFQHLCLHCLSLA